MKIGFIGCGNMATAMLKGILKSGEVSAQNALHFSLHPDCNNRKSSDLTVLHVHNHIFSPNYCRILSDRDFSEMKTHYNDMR